MHCAVRGREADLLCRWCNTHNVPSGARFVLSSATETDTLHPTSTCTTSTPHRDERAQLADMVRPRRHGSAVGNRHEAASETLVRVSFSKKSADGHGKKEIHKGILLNLVSVSAGN